MIMQNNEEYTCCEIFSNLFRLGKHLTSLNYFLICDNCELTCKEILVDNTAEAGIFATYCPCDIYYYNNMHRDNQIILLTRGFIPKHNVDKYDIKAIGQCDDDIRRNLILSSCEHNLPSKDTRELWYNKNYKVMRRLKNRMNGLHKLHCETIEELNVLMEFGILDISDVTQMMINGVKMPTDLPFDDTDLITFRCFIIWLQPESALDSWKFERSIMDEIPNRRGYIPLHLFIHDYKFKSCLWMKTKYIVEHYEHLTHCPDICEVISSIKWHQICDYNCDISPAILYHIEEKPTINYHNLTFIARHFKLLNECVDGFLEIYMEFVCNTYTTGSGILLHSDDFDYSDEGGDITPIDLIESTYSNIQFMMDRNPRAAEYLVNKLGQN